MSAIKVGDKVWTGVHVGHEWRRMASGIVTEVRSGYYRVDIMGLHGGTPWVTDHQHLEPFTEEVAKEHP